MTLERGRTHALRRGYVTKRLLGERLFLDTRFLTGKRRGLFALFKLLHVIRYLWFRHLASLTDIPKAMNPGDLSSSSPRSLS